MNDRDRQGLPFSGFFVLALVAGIVVFQKQGLEDSQALQQIFQVNVPAYARWRNCRWSLRSFETNEAINALDNIGKQILAILKSDAGGPGS